MAQLHHYVTRRWWSSVVTVVILLSGCASSPHFQVSVPLEVPAGVSGQINDELILINLHSVAVELQLQNFQTQPGWAPRPLALWLEIGGTPGTLTLDPRQVTLMASGGSAQQALTFLGPSDAWQSPRAVARGCGPRRYALGWSISKVDVSMDDVLHGNPNKGIRNPEVSPVSFEGKRCFMFWFDTDPSPDLPFTVSIHGVTRDGVPVTIPDVHFGPGKARKTVIP